MNDLEVEGVGRLIGVFIKMSVQMSKIMGKLETIKNHKTQEWHDKYGKRLDVVLESIECVDNEAMEVAQVLQIMIDERRKS